VGLGAILVIGAKSDPFIEGTDAPHCDQNVFAGPLACAEILGRSMAERMVERLVRVELDAISVLVKAEASNQLPLLRNSFPNVCFEVVEDAESALARKLRDYSMQGIKRAFVQGAGVYTETDLMDFYYFHREARQAATRAFDREGALPLWVVDCAMPGEVDIPRALGVAGRNGVSYFVREYVHRLAHPRDLRGMAADILQGRCEKTATGKEIRPGVWIEEGAKVHRRARIVGPAYIGRRSKVRADTLLTRCSSVERDCCVDYGTVIENSSLLPNTQVGIWLDVCHAIANGNKLFSLGLNVGIEISDASVMRSSGPVLSRNPEVDDWNEARMSAPDFEHKLLTQPAWHLGANLIQE
jgi:hypothetical protein